MAHRQHLALCLTLCLIGLIVAQQGKEELLQRSKRTLTTICVEIKPSGPQDEPYFMCKGADFTHGGQLEEQRRPKTTNNYQQSAHSPTANYQQPQPAISHQPITFPSFPAFGAGFFPAPATTANNYESIYGEQQSKAQPQSHAHAHSPSQAPIQPQSQSSYGNYGGSAAAYAPASAPPSYGLSAVSYTDRAGTAAAARGAPAGPGTASTSAAYAAPAAKKPSTAAKAQNNGQSKSQPQPPGANYDSLGSSRHRANLDADVLAVPDVGFHPAELQSKYRRPNGGQAATPLVGAAPELGPRAQPDYSDDRIMRIFYDSLQPQQSQQQQYQQQPQSQPQPQSQFQLTQPGQAFAQPAAPLLGQSQTAYQSAYAQPAVAPLPANYNDYAKPTKSIAEPPATPVYSPVFNSYAQPADSNACSACQPARYSPPTSRACPAVFDNAISYASACPSFQPVIIAMPCYGQQPPTHYLAVPSDGYGNAAGGGGGGGALPRVQEPVVGSPFGQPMGHPLGLTPTVGAPFGMGPLSPFGAFGSLNPFNPFNRLLGAANPAAQAPQLAAPNPLQRLFNFGGQAAPAPTMPMPPTVGAAEPTRKPGKTGKLNFLASSTSAPAVTVGAALEEPADELPDEEDDATGSNESTEAPTTDAEATEGDAATADGQLAMSLESDGLSAKELVDKAEDKLKTKDVGGDKRKRHNLRASNGSTQKRKYLQRL